MRPQLPQVMGQWINLAEKRKPSLERFLDGLLRVKAEYLIGEDTGVSHAAQGRQVPLRGRQKLARLFKIAHKAPCPPAVRARGRD